MAYQLSSRLVVGLASSALFDLTESDSVFQAKGESAYRDYQRKHQDNPLSKGVAFSFVKRLLSLNALSPENPVVEVILLSKNDADTGLRVMNSIEHYGLNISRAMFLQGRSPYPYIKSLDIELFLSANLADVQQAIDAGFPAGHIQEGFGQETGELNHIDTTANQDERELRIAFDFDGVIADDESETVFQSENLDGFQAHEKEKVDVPHSPGPLKPFLARISQIQQLELEKQAEDESYEPILRISIVTARNAPSHKRVINTMRSWGINVNEAFFMGGIEKSRVISVLKPHMFFDDQKGHLDHVSHLFPSVHVPFGVANRSKR